MITVKFFGILRLDLKMAKIEVEAQDVKELLLVLSKKIDGLSPEYLKENMMYVNGTNVMDLKKYRTKLKEGDEVLIMSPVSGG